MTNAQHFDAFIPFSGFDTRFVPLHVYFTQAMDAMYAHLKNGHGAAAEPGGADDAARRRAGRRAGDHRGQRAGHQRRAGGGQPDRLRRHVAERSELTHGAGVGAGSSGAAPPPPTRVTRRAVGDGGLAGVARAHRASARS